MGCVMLSFAEFVQSFSTNSCVKKSRTAKKIYDSIICDEQIRITMAELSDANRPAILACGNLIETLCSDKHSDLDLSDNRIKCTIGRMIATSLEPLGYTKKRQTPLPKNSSCDYFTSGSVFHKTTDGTQKIIKKIINI